MNGAAVTLPEATQTKAGAVLGGAKMARHASFNVTPTPVGAQRLVSSAPSSPRRDVTGKRCLPRSASQSFNRAFCVPIGSMVIFFTPQVCRPSLWIIPKRPRATAPCVGCSLAAALSELMPPTRSAALSV